MRYRLYGEAVSDWKSMCGVLRIPRWTRRFEFPDTAPLDNAVIIPIIVKALGIKSEQESEIQVVKQKVDKR